MFNVLFINIIMVGEVGVGKFLFLNIVVIVLENSNCIKELYRVFFVKGRENSVIKMVIYYIFNLYLL